MSIIYFIRHGRTDWNRLCLFRGHADRPLDEVGLRQAELVADALKDQKIDAIYASPLCRTVETVTPLRAKKRSLEIKLVPELIDIDYGKWQGMPKDEVAEKFPGLWKQWDTDPFSVAFPSGESLIQVQERALAGVDKILEASKGKNIVVCSHRVVLKAIFCGFVGSISPRAFYTFKIDPASISIVRFEDDLPIIESLNDSRHLRGNDLLGGPPDF